MPTEGFGLTFFAFLIVPGLAFAYHRERHRPARKRSSFRETATAAFVGVLSCAAVAVVILLASWLSDPIATATARLISEPNAVRVEDPLLFGVYVLSALTAVTVVAWLLGSKSVDDWITSEEVAAKDLSSWGVAFRANEDTYKFVTLRMKSGDWIRGYLDTFGDTRDEDDVRAMTIVGHIEFRSAGTEEFAALDAGMLVVQSVEIELLMVNYHSELPHAPTEKTVELPALPTSSRDAVEAETGQPGGWRAVFIRETRARLCRKTPV